MNFRPSGNKFHPAFYLRQTVAAWTGLSQVEYLTVIFNPTIRQSAASLIFSQMVRAWACRTLLFSASLAARSRLWRLWAVKVAAGIPGGEGYHPLKFIRLPAGKPEKDLPDGAHPKIARGILGQTADVAIAAVRSQVMRREYALTPWLDVHFITAGTPMILTKK